LGSGGLACRLHDLAEYGGQRQLADDRAVGVEQPMQMMLGRQNMPGLVDELGRQPLNRQVRRVAELHEITGVRLGELITGHVTPRLVGGLWCD
jgi:hypothetical protein